uniref:Uncharacterized protein n=1 Tax=Leersia perrieri TaxID=77586 RepID=A0A0D9XR64_9ORYZ
MVKFSAVRSKPELVVPARVTPHELKHLSDIDNQQSLRFYATFVEFFQLSDSINAHKPQDSAKAIKSALAEALVYYYPLAGRLTELPDGKLVVDCTAEGVVFVEADADVRLEELGQPLLPPYPCVKQFLCDPGDTKVVVGKPLFFVQFKTEIICRNYIRTYKYLSLKSTNSYKVTRLKCGGFVVGFHICHNINDGFGMFHFIRAIADIARGEASPTIFPLWNRELLTSMCPSQGIRHKHLAYEPLHDGSQANDIMQSTPSDAMVGQYFLFGPAEISAIRSHVPAYLRQSTIFELISAAIWKCRTAALETMVSELCGNPLGYAVELVRKAKFDVNDEYVESTVDMMASRKWPSLIADRTYVVSDITTIGEDKVDFGWAKRIGGGVPMEGDILSKLLSYYMKCKNADGEDCVVVPMYLPSITMDKFSTEISVWSKKQGHKFPVI